MSTDQSIAEVVAQLAQERPGGLLFCELVASWPGAPKSSGWVSPGAGFANSWRNGLHQTRSGPRVTQLETRGLITTVPNTGQLHFLMPHRTEIEDALAGLLGAMVFWSRGPRSISEPIFRPRTGWGSRHCQTAP